MKTALAIIIAITSTAALFFAPIFGLLGSIVAITLMFGIPLLYYRRKKAAFADVLLEGRPWLAQIGWGFALMLVMMVLAVSAISFLAMAFNMSFLELLRIAIGWQPNILYALIIIGFGEELFFRGYILDMLKDASKSKWLAIGLSSLLFGLAHFQLGILHPDFAYYAGVSAHFATVAMWGNIAFCIAVGVLLASARIFLKNVTLLSLSIAHGFYWIIMPLIMKGQI